jgi:hypothetical protein
VRRDLWITELSSDKLDVRIGGIYVLERIARDSARDHPAVMKVVSAFIREHSRERWPPLGPGAEEARRSPRPDVPGRRYRDRGLRAERDIGLIDLAGANLTGANLRFADLTGVDLNRADLGMRISPSQT